MAPSAASKISDSEPAAAQPARATSAGDDMRGDGVTARNPEPGIERDRPAAHDTSFSGGARPDPGSGGSGKRQSGDGDDHSGSGSGGKGGSDGHHGSGSGKGSGKDGDGSGSSHHGKHGGGKIGGGSTTRRGDSSGPSHHSRKNRSGQDASGASGSGRDSSGTGGSDDDSVGKGKASTTTRTTRRPPQPSPLIPRQLDQVDVHRLPAERDGG